MALPGASLWYRLRLLACGATVAVGAILFTQAAASANSCTFATGLSAHALCWLDFRGYTVAPGATIPVSFTLPDGSTLTANVTNTGTVTSTTAAIPTYSLAALGRTAYTGLGGQPAIGTQPNQTVTLVLSNVVLTDAQGRIVSNLTIAGADAESLDTGDGTSASMTWTTTGTPLSVLQIMPRVGNNATTPICTLVGVGTLTARCTPNSGTNNAAYILSSTIGTGQTFSMGETTLHNQFFAFAVEVAQLTAIKSLPTRENPGDQFTVSVQRGGATVTSANTTGTNTSASTTALVDAGSTFTLNDAVANGSTANLANYISTYACTNLTAGSTTIFPTSGTGTSVTVTPAVDDQISCTFTNSAVTLTVVPVSPTKAVQAGTSVTDLFTLTNTSSVAGNVTVGTPTITTPGGPITPTGYTYKGTTYATLAALQAAITLNGAVAAGASFQIGIVYSTPNPGVVATVNLPATIAAQGATSNTVTGTETDTSSAVLLTIAKTGTTAASPGGPIGYSILVSNATTFPGDGALFSDPVPAGLNILGTPTCTVTSGAATCGAVSVSGNNITSTISKLPANSSVTFDLTATTTTAGTYTNTATASTTGVSGATASSSLTTTVAAANGLTKAVRNVTSGDATGALGKPHDVLEYTLTFKNTTSVALSSFVFSDATPANTTFVSAVCGALPTGVSNCSVTSPAVGTTGNVRWTYTGSLASGATITALLRVAIN